jgi:hypothetical protein
MYEPRYQKPIHRSHFIRRMITHALVSLSVVAGSLFLGMAGYAAFENLAWNDAFLNAAMLLGGMGPVESPQTDAGKIFAGFYALYAGLVFLVAVGVLVAPLLHRMLHLFHWSDKKGE